MGARFPEDRFCRVADAVTMDLQQARRPAEDPKVLEKRLRQADQLIPPSIWRLLRRAFTLRGLPFFEFYLSLYKIRLGDVVTPGLRQQYKRAADRLAQVRSPVDKQPLSPTAVNHIAMTRQMVNRTLQAVEQGRIDDPIVWGRFNAVFVPLIIEVAKDKGVYIKPTRQVGRERWATFRKMSPKQERIEKLKDDDPEAYALMSQLGQSMEEIDAAIESRIEAEGKQIKKGFLAGRPVLIGVDQATGEEMVYDRDGEVIPKADFFDKVRNKAEAQQRLRRVPERTVVPPDELRLLGEEELDQLTGTVEWDAITDDKAKQGRITRLFPTRRTRKFISDPETGALRVDEYKVVTGGRYQGVFLDDLINSEGRLVEGTAYTYDPKRGKASTVPERIDPSEREPYVSVADVVEQRTFQGKRIKIRKKRLYLKIDGTRQSAVLRNAIKQLACNAGAKTGCIPSVVYEPVKGSRAAGFYFDPKDFGVIMESLQGMSLSSAALAEVKGYYKELARAEQATKNLDPYEPAALASENDAGERFQFITGHYDDGGTWHPFSLREKQKEAIAWMDANGNSGVCALDTGVGKCVREDTLILTNKGLTPIRDINPGVTEPDTTVSVEDWSVLVNGTARPIKNFYYGGSKPTIKVRTRRGYEVEGSLIHPLLVRTPDGQETWVPTPELETGDFLCIERKEAEFPAEDPTLSVPVADDFQNGTIFDAPSQMTPDLGRLLGYIVGEGWTNSHKTFTISQCPEKNPEVRADIEDLLYRLLGWTAKPEKDIRIWSVFLRAYLTRMGVGMGVAKDKAVPEVILRSSKETVRQFIKGLVDAECTVHGTCRSHIEFSTASERLGRELQILLLRFGIVCSRCPKKVNAYPDNDYWRLTITGQDAVEYQRVIGFVSERKIAASENVPETRNSNLDVVPHIAPAVGSLFDAILVSLGMSISAFRRTTGSASFDNTVSHVRRGRRNPTYSFLQKMLSLATDVGCQEHPSFEAIARVVDRRFFYDPIEALDESNAVVMDIEVGDPSHCFVGNGVMNHNTATAAGMMLKLVRDGLAEPDATYTRPDGTVVQTNGRFLFVCPTSLRGNIKKEVRKLLSDPKVMLDRLDVLSYPQFSRAARTGTVPRQLRGIPFWKARIGKGKQAKSKAWDPALYAGIFFDEAQAMKNPSSKTAQAALTVYHPRKVCLTASPMERNPMEAYVLAAITNNTPLFGRSLEARTNRQEMRRFKERFCEVVGGRIVGVKQDPLVQRDLHTWVKRNVFYADKTEVKEYNLPTPEVTTTPVYMPTPVEDIYRDVASQFAVIMQGAARKFSERTRGDAYGDRQAERIFSLALRPIISLLTKLANRPQAALGDIAYAVEHGNLPGHVTKAGEPRALPKPFLSVLKKWQEQYDPGALQELAVQVGNPKIRAAEEFLAAKLERARGSRSLIFADDRVLCMEAGQHLAKTIAGTHIVALNDAIHFFRGGQELPELVFPLDTGLLDRLVRDPKGRAAILQETQGLTRHKLPFSKRALKLHPALPAKQGMHQGYLADDWQQFVLKEIVSPNPAIKTATLLGNTYMYGHNLQAFNTVIHLDRNNWNSESMKQRTARSWRQGQDQVVDEVTFDMTYAPDDQGVERSEQDRTLDQIRAAFQGMDAAIFDDIIKAAQQIELGAEWEGIDKKDASLWRLDKKVVEMLTSPYLGRVKGPREAYSS